MNHSDTALQQALKDYRARLPERARQLATLGQSAGRGDETARNQLLQQLHRLAGSAGMYGLAQLGQQAKQVHHALKQEDGNAAKELQQLLAMMNNS